MENLTVTHLVCPDQSRLNAKRKKMNDFVLLVGCDVGFHTANF